jgi:hypothetical protein
MKTNAKQVTKTPVIIAKFESANGLVSITGSTENEIRKTGFISSKSHIKKISKKVEESKIPGLFPFPGSELTLTPFPARNATFPEIRITKIRKLTNGKISNPFIVQQIRFLK